MAYPEAVELATQSAKSDSEGFLRRLPFLRRGTEIGDHTGDRNKKTVHLVRARLRPLCD